MILRLLTKIGLKALLPVVAVAGIGSYMMYMNGGDPASTAKQLVTKVQNSGQSAPAGLGTANSNPGGSIVGNIGSTVGATLGQARQTVARAAAVVTGEEQPAASTPDGLRTVYRWVDSSGGTQFGTHPSADAREIESIGLRRGGSGAPATAAAKPRDEGYPLGKSHAGLLQHISVPD